MNRPEHMREAIQWLQWAEACYTSGIAEEMSAARVCAEIGQLHLAVARALNDFGDPAPGPAAAAQGLTIRMEAKATNA